MATTKSAKNAQPPNGRASTQSPSLPSAPVKTGSPASTIQFAPVPSEPESLGIPSVPRWKRAADSRMRKKVARILVLKMAGRKTAEIAKRLGTTPDTIRHYLYIAGKNGWLTADGVGLVDPSEQLLFEASHKIARNVNHALDGKILGAQQFEMTIESAKGLGYFKNHSAIKTEGQISLPPLEIKFELPKGAPISFNPPVPDSYGGKPGYVEGEVVAPAQLTEGEGDAISK